MRLGIKGPETIQKMKPTDTQGSYKEYTSYVMIDYFTSFEV